MIIRKLESLIIETDSKTRLRLKEVMNQLVLKSELHYALNFKDAKEKLQNKPKLDAVFIRSSSKREDILKFLKYLNESYPNLAANTVFLIKAKNDESLYISEFYLSGVTHFLKEPYNVDSLRTILTAITSDKTSEKNEEQKNYIASQMMLKEALEAIDDAAAQLHKTKGRGAGPSIVLMRNISPVLRSALEKVSPEKYEYLLITEVLAKLKTMDASQLKKSSRSKAVKAAEHPGVILARVMKKRNLTVDNVAAKLQLEEEELQSILDAKTDLNPDISKALARVLGNTEDYWQEQQKAYTAYQSSKIQN